MGYATKTRNFFCRLVLGRQFASAGEPGRRAIAITFDDGPIPAHTPRLMSLLEAHGGRGTFFVIGAFAETQPEIMRRLVEGGHEIGNHSMRHRAFAAMAPARQFAEIEEADKVLERYDGRPAHWFRPPQGRITPAMLLALGRRRHPVAMWSLDSFDYRGLGVEAIVSRFDSRPARPGDVLLFHDDNDDTVRALEKLVPRWRAEGYEFLTLSELLGRRAGEGVAS